MTFDDFIITDWTGAPIICVFDETIKAIAEWRSKKETVPECSEIRAKTKKEAVK